MAPQKTVQWTAGNAEAFNESQCKWPNTCKYKHECPLVVKLVRHLVLLCLELNIWIKAQHMPVSSNKVTNALPWFQLVRFWVLVPWAEEIGEKCPDHLLGIIWS